jgi:hypothetical protein
MATLIGLLAATLFCKAVLHQSLARAATYVGVDLYILQAPADLPHFSALYAFGGQVGGRAAMPLSDTFHAVLWSGPAGTPVDLTPVRTAQVNGLVAGQQVGSVSPDLTVGAAPGPHAAFWSGTRASMVDLNPSELMTSAALATDGNHQVGYVTVALSAGGSRIPQAALWSGSAASVINLHPAGYTQSQANAVRDGQEVGQAVTGSVNHAMLWSGAAASAIDLNPAGADSSFALGVGGGQQVGVANFPGFSSHAALWSGTVGSFVDLTPPNSASTIFSEALDVRGGVQVGYVQVGSFDHAYLWTSTAASATDLQLLLPENLEHSRALSIDATGNIFGLAGDASGHTHAVEWSPVPEPPTFALLFGGLILLVASQFCAQRARRNQRWRAAAYPPNSRIPPSPIPASSRSPPPPR